MRWHNSPVSYDAIPQSLKFGDIEEITAAKLSKEIESYLKEEGISKVKDLRNERERIGMV